MPVAAASGLRGPRRRVLSRMALALVCAGVAACAALLPRLEPPRVALASIRVERLSADGVRLGLALAVDNPNDRGVRLDALDLSFALSGVTVGSTRLADPVFLTPLQTTQVSVIATGSTAAWTAALGAIGRSMKVAYEIRGTATLEGRQLPLTRSGERDVLDLLSRAR